MTVRRDKKWVWAGLLTLLLAGCSTSPIADLMDLCCPGQFPANARGTTGGVCVPQGGVAGPAPGVPGPPGPPGPPGGEIPPPAPINRTPPPGLPK